MNELWKYNTTGISDNLFIRGKVPMTKSEVRSVTLSKLKLKSGLNILDIGAGTGSVTIECGLLGCSVTAIERNLAGVELIKENLEHFNIKSSTLIHGLAPEDLPKKSIFQRAFIGGSGGNIEDVFKYLDSSLETSGILVANTITIENTGKILNLLEVHGYLDIEAVTINISRSKKVGSVNMMIAENPITILSGVKGENICQK